MRRAVVLLVAWCAAACSGGAAADGLLRPGDHRIDLAYGGRARGYVVHVPPAVAGGRALPVVLNFHGAASSGAGQQRFSRMDAVADRAGFVVVYPDGTGRYRRFFTWNAGTCCGSAVLQQVDDVGFALAVLDDCARRMPIDRERVYATGMSNGAMMAHRLAAQVPERIAAIAPVAGGLVYPLSGRGPAVPVLHIHSVDDPLALYRGGLGRHTAMDGVRVLHPDIETMIRRWAAHDGCPPEPRVAAVQRAANGQTATHLVWAPCRDGAEVGLWRLTGAGHVWPGAPAHMPRLLGTDTEVIDADQEIWDFVSRFRRRSGA